MKLCWWAGDKVRKKILDSLSRTFQDSSSWDQNVLQGPPTKLSFQTSSVWNDRKHVINHMCDRHLYRSQC